MKNLITYLRRINLILLIGSSALAAGCSNNSGNLGFSERIKKSGDSKNDSQDDRNSVEPEQKKVVYNPLTAAITEKRRRAALQLAIEEKQDKAETLLETLLLLEKNFYSVATETQQYEQELFSEIKTKHQEFYQKKVGKKGIKEYRKAMKVFKASCESLRNKYYPDSDQFLGNFRELCRKLEEQSVSLEELHKEIPGGQGTEEIRTKMAGFSNDLIGLSAQVDLFVMILDEKYDNIYKKHADTAFKKLIEVMNRLQTRPENRFVIF